MTAAFYARIPRRQLTANYRAVQELAQREHGGAAGTGGIRPGAGLRRGTLGLLADTAPALLLTFRAACRCRSLFLQLIYRQLRRLDFAISDELYAGSYMLYHGDMVAEGRGELLIKQ